MLIKECVKNSKEQVPPKTLLNINLKRLTKVLYSSTLISKHLLINKCESFNDRVIFKVTGLDLLITTIGNNINNSDTGKTKSHSNLVQKYTKTVTFFHTSKGMNFK